MIRIPRNIFEEVLVQARAEAPLEACGIFAGQDGCVQASHPMTNVDASAEHFSLKPEEQFAVAKAIRAAGHRMLAVYHSHPATPARPSEEDIRLAVAPGVLQVIVSLASAEPEIKAFSIEDGQATNVPINLGPVQK